MTSPVAYLRTLPAKLGGALGALLWMGVVYRAFGVVVFAPLTALLFRWFLARTDRVVLIDQDIGAFLLEPAGALAGLVMVTVVLTLIALEQACLMTILHSHAGGAPLGAVATLRFVLARGLGVFALAARVVLQVVLLMLPFVAIAGLVYLWLLTEYDINYYLAEKPREYVIGLVLGILIGLGLLGVLLWYVGRVIVALPILLFEGLSPREALTESSRRTRGDKRQIVALLLAWALAGLVISVLLGLPSLLVGDVLIPRFGTDTTALMVVVGLLLMTLFLSQLIASLLTAAAFSVASIAVYEPTARVAPSWQERVTSANDRGRRSLSAPFLMGLAAVAAVVAFFVGWVALGEMELEDRSEVTAHRGASGLAPENTLAALERAIADGADWAEVDVQRSGDGMVVVVHDRDLQRLGGASLVVTETVYAELAKVDVGSWFDAAFSDQRVPTLKDVLTVGRDRIGLTIELKYYGWDEALAPAVIELVEEAGMADQVVLMSLDARAVAQAKTLRPHWQVGQLTAVAVGDLTRIEADFLAVQAGSATPRLVRRVHASGKGLKVWTVNDVPGMHAMYSLGVDAIITDFPAKALAVRTERAELDAAQRLLLGIGLLTLDPPDDVEAEMSSRIP